MPLFTVDCSVTKTATNKLSGSCEVSELRNQNYVTHLMRSCRVSDCHDRVSDCFQTHDCYVSDCHHDDDYVSDHRVSGHDHDCGHG